MRDDQKISREVLDRLIFSLAFEEGYKKSLLLARSLGRIDFAIAISAMAAIAPGGSTFPLSGEPLLEEMTEAMFSELFLRASPSREQWATLSRNFFSLPRAFEQYAWLA